VSAWVLASFLLCARANAAVVEAAPAPLPVVPGGAAIGAAGAANLGGSLLPSNGGITLVPSLTPALSLSPSAIGAALGAAPGAGVVRLAPAAVPALPASAVTGAAAAAPTAETSAPEARPAAAEELPPPAAVAGDAVAPAAAARRAPASADSFGAVSAADAARAAVPAPAGGLERASAESAAASSRALWDSAADRAALDSSSLFAMSRSLGVLLARSGLRPWSRDASVGALAAGGETLRDAVGAPVPVPAYARAASGARENGSFAALGPTRWVAGSAAAAAGAIERLTLSIGGGLTVSVRAALGASSIASAASSASAAAARAAARPAEPGASGVVKARRALPLLSTEFIERRGLLETVAAIPEPLSAAWAASSTAPRADGRALRAASSSAPASAASAARRPRPLAPTREAGSSPLAWWALAFLPATLALLRDPLR